MIANRTETRRERYQRKSQSAKTLPVSVVTVTFVDAENLGYVVRAAACYGAAAVHVIGALPEHKELKRLSGGTCEFIDVIQHSNPFEFIHWLRENDADLVCAELTENAKSIYETDFNLSKHTVIAIGHETTGVPTELLLNGKVVYIPMPGPGFCLNTAQTANAMLFEYNRQRFSKM